MKKEFKNIFITGAAGFIGSEFSRKAYNLESFNNIFLLDSLTYASDLERLSEIINKSNVHFIEANINDSSSYSSALADCEYAIHFAAESHVDKSINSGHSFVDTNIVGSYIFLENCRLANNLRTLFVSTDEVYGSIKIGEADETSKLNPSSIYSASKTSSDLLALANYVTHSQNVLITRCCNNYGPYQHKEKFIPTVINNLLLNKKVPIYGSGENIREWIHVSDHVSALFTLLDSGKAGEVYNIGTGIRYSNLEIFSIIAKGLNFGSNEINFVADRKGHDFRYSISSSKLRKEFGWVPKFNLDEGLLSTLNWYRNWQLEKGKVY